jgi:probable HAF family extracellular repeat protein
MDLNNRGEIVGSSHRFFGDNGRAFLWRDGVMTDLSPQVGEGTGAVGINDHGHIVGNRFSDGQLTYFLFDGQLHDLPLAAFDVNGVGRVIGRVETDIGFSAAYQDRGGTVQVLPTFGGGPEATAHDVNDAGVIVGAADVRLRGFSHAFLWDGTLHDLGALGGDLSWASAVNDQGQVVGGWSMEPGSVSRGFLYDGATMRDLGTFGGDRGGAIDINNRGQILGSSYTRGFEGAPDVRRAFLYEDGTAYDLNDLIDARLGSRLEDAVAINDFGQIVASGYVNNQRHYYFLTPVPEPSLLVSALVGAVPFVSSRRRRRHDTRSSSRASA